jgi:hypothetical protein
MAKMKFIPVVASPRTPSDLQQAVSMVDICLCLLCWRPGPQLWVKVPEGGEGADGTFFALGRARRLDAGRARSGEYIARVYGAFWYGVMVYGIIGGRTPKGTVWMICFAKERALGG